MINVQTYLPKAYITAVQMKPAIVIEVYKQFTSKVIEIIRLNDNNQAQAHIKRVRKAAVLIDCVEVFLCFQSDQQKGQRMRKLLVQYIQNTKIVQIALNAPCTKEQYNDCSKHWPLIFIEQQIYKEIKHSTSEIELLQQQSSKGNRLVVLNQEKALLSLQIQVGCQPGTINHPIMKLLQQWPQTQTYKQLQSAYYLTKLWLIYPLKLCGMCAMALVHSRLQRIYLSADIQLSIIQQILSNEKMNHRIKILKISK